VSSYSEEQQREGSSATIAGVLAATAMFVSLIGIAYRPARVVPVAVVVALVALGMGGRHERLAWFALAVAGVAWLVGMTVAITVNHPIF
jgi:hypothetical protein